MTFVVGVATIVIGRILDNCDWCCDNCVNGIDRVPNVKYVAFISDKLPETLCDTLKNECSSLIVFPCRPFPHTSLQTHKTYCGMDIITRSLVNVSTSGSYSESLLCSAQNSFH